METSFLTFSSNPMILPLMAAIAMGSFIGAIYCGLEFFLTEKGNRKAKYIVGAVAAFACATTCAVPVGIGMGGNFDANDFANQITEQYDIKSQNNVHTIYKTITSTSTETMTELPDTEHVVTYNNGQLVATDERFAIRVTKTFKGELPIKEATAKIEMFHAIGDSEETVFIPIDENTSNTAPTASYEPTDAPEE